MFHAAAVLRRRGRETAANGQVASTTLTFKSTPPNTTSGTVYLKATVSWAATASNIGTFNVRFNYFDDAVAARLGMGKSTNTAGSGFDFITLNGVNNPDGAGPATARPAITPVNTSTKTSVTLVMKVDHSKAGTNPGGDTPFSTAPPVVDPATSTVSASPTAIPADGVSTSIITVTLKAVLQMPTSVLR